MTIGELRIFREQWGVGDDCELLVQRCDRGGDIYEVPVAMVRLQRSRQSIQSLVVTLP